MRRALDGEKQRIAFVRLADNLLPEAAMLAASSSSLVPGGSRLTSDVVLPRDPHARVPPYQRPSVEGR